MRLQLCYPQQHVDFDDAFGISLKDVPVVEQDQVQSVSDLPFFRAIPSKHFSFIPEELFDPRFVREYLLQLGMPAGVQVATKEIKPWNGVLVYSLEKAAPGTPSNLQRSLWEPLLTYFHWLTNQDEKEGMLGHISAGWLYLIAGGPQNLEFFNQFPIQEPQDALYFLLKGMNQWNQSPSSLPVWLSGQYVTNSPLFDLISQYIADLEPAQVPETSLVGLDRYTAHHYPDLRSFAACVSSAGLSKAGE